MRLVTVTADRDVVGPPRDLVQRINNRPPPVVVGLAARHWYVDRHRANGHYLFEHEGDARRFAQTPSDHVALDILRENVSGRSTMTTAMEVLDPAEHALDRPIFIVSAPRSGSTLLAETLSLAEGLWSLEAEGQAVVEGIPALHLANRDYVSHRLTDLDAGGSTRSSLTAGYLASLRDRQGRRWSQAGQERPRHPRMLDKTPENAIRILFLLAVFPDARFVLMHRQMRPNVASILSAWHHPGFTNIADLPGWSRKRWCFLLPDGWRSYDAAPLSDVAAFQWRSANERAMDDLDALPRSTWCTVAYEELVARPDPTIRRLCDELELDIGVDLERRLARELPLSATTTTVPTPVKWRSDPRLLDSSFARLGHVGGRLRALDVGTAALAAPAQPSDPPREWFSCRLEHLNPAKDQDSTWMVNPTLHVQLGASPPSGLANRTRFRDRFLPDHPILWVENPITGALDPFWARQTDAWWVRLLRPGGPVPDQLGEHTLGALGRAGVLLPAGRVPDGPGPVRARLDAASAALLADRHAALPELLHPAQRQAYSAYYDRLIRSGKWSVGDGQVTRRYGWHDEPMARFLHHQLTGLVSRVAAEPVKPTYSYSSAYCGGAALDAHTDRKQCEFTLSLLLDESSAPGTDPWPLWFAGPTGRAQVVLSPGEAVLFRGCELPHWREAAPAEHEQTMLLFHYVPSGFAGPRS